MEIDYKLLDNIFKKDYQVIKKIEGGMTNFSHLIFSKGKYYILYQGSEFANSTIDRDLEQKIQAVIYSLGLTSKNIYFDTTNGVKINEFITGESLNNIDNFSYESVAKLLHALHDKKIKCEKTFEPLSAMTNYLEIAKSKNILLDSSFYQMFEYFKQNYLYLNSFEKILCHNDFQKSNIVCSAHDKYYMIDFEFAMNNDPIYDIAAFANNKMEEGIKLLKFYFKGKITDDDYKRFYLYRMFLSLQWYVLAMIKSQSEDQKLLNCDFNTIGQFFLNNAKECSFQLINN